MALLQPSSLRRGQAGNTNIGIVERSIGYLQGGYYTGTLPGTRNDGSTYPPPGQSRGAGSAWQAIQLFNCITQVGTIVYNSGFYRRYYAGVSGNTSGYYSSDTTTNFQKFDYINITSSNSFQLAGYSNNLTSNDLGVFTQAWILSAGTGEFTSSYTTKYYKITLSTDTPTDKGSLNVNPLVTSRQALNNAYAAFIPGVNSGGFQTMYSLSYATETVSSQISFNAMSQIYVGMSVNNTYGYLIGFNNVKFNLSGTSVTSYSNSVAYTYLFGESHSLTSSTNGFVMAGYYDTSGRYSGVQHALCERLTLATETTTIMNDVQLPQSSGQMMQGF